MAAPVTALQPLKLPAGPSRVTPEYRYWHSFRSQLLIPSPHSNPITHISFPTPAPNTISSSSTELFAVTSGSRIQVFSSRTRKLLKTVSRFGFDDVAHSGEIRRDGRVLVAGGDSGAVQVFDINSRAILKTWKEHKQPVWTTKWCPTDPTTLMSASDDRTVRLWDLPSQESTITLTGHQDYVRSGVFMPGQGASLLATGSYDQTTRIWDPRTPDRAVMIFRHAAAVESLLPMPSGTTLLVSAENQISVLDLIAAKPVQILQSHQKTITCMSLASNATRVVSGGLDGHTKIYETSGWSTVAGSKYTSPILALSVVSLGANAEDRHLVVGLQSGLMSLKTRTTGKEKTLARERRKEMQALIDGKIEDYDKKAAKKRPSGIEKRLRGLDYDGAGAAIVIEGNDRARPKKLSAWDRALRNNQYAKALDLALALTPSQPIVVLTILTALVHRSALEKALRDRDEVTLQPILKWLTKHINDPRHIMLTARVSMLVLELYAPYLHSSSTTHLLVKRLHDKVRFQVDNSQAACSTQGMLDMVMS